MEFIKRLISELGSSDANVRARAVEVLGYCKHWACAQLLLKMQSDVNPGVRKNAVTALGKVPGSAVNENYFIRMLDDEDHGVRSAAQDALRERKFPATTNTLCSIVLNKKKSDRMRIEAAKVLCCVADQSATGALLSVLKDGNEEIRQWAVHALAKAAGKLAVQPLIEMLGSTNHLDRYSAAMALGELSDSENIQYPVPAGDQVAPLIAALDDSDKSVCYAAVWALGKIHARSAVPRLIRCLGDENRHVEKAAARSLGQIKDARALGPLLDLLKAVAQGKRKFDTSPEERMFRAVFWDYFYFDVSWAMNAIGCSRMTKALIPLLKSKNNEALFDVIELLANAKEARAIEPLVKLMRRRIIKSDFSQLGIDAGALLKDLRKNGYINKDGIIQEKFYVLSHRAIMRRVGAWSLMNLNPLYDNQKHDIYRIVSLCGDVCERAAEALGKIGDARALEPLIASKRNGIGDRDGYFDAIGLALVKMKSLRVRRRMLGIFQDSRESEQMRIWAVKVLGQIKEKSVVSHIAGVLSDTQVSIAIKEEAVFALGNIGGAMAERALLKALQSNDDPIRASAAMVLGWLQAKRAIKVLKIALGDASASVRVNAADALGRIGICTLKPLVELLQDANAQIRSAAVDALRNLKDSRAVQPLLKLLKDKSSEVQQRAIYALEHLGDRRALNPLYDYLMSASDKQVVYSVKIALETIAARVLGTSRKSQIKGGD